jgi:hypothetical protein
LSRASPASLVPGRATKSPPPVIAMSRQKVAGPKAPRAAMDLVTRHPGAGQAGARRQPGPAVRHLGHAWIAGYLSIWLPVRHQPVHGGPSPWAYAVLGLCMVAALVPNGLSAGRAVRWRDREFGHVRWATAAQQRAHVRVGVVHRIRLPVRQCWRLAHAGASSAKVTGLLGAAGPVLVVAAMYLAAGALWRYWTVFILGAWLVLAISALIGPSLPCGLSLPLSANDYRQAAPILIVGPQGALERPLRANHAPPNPGGVQAVEPASPLGHRCGSPCRDGTCARGCI